MTKRFDYEIGDFVADKFGEVGKYFVNLIENIIEDKEEIKRFAFDLMRRAK